MNPAALFPEEHRTNPVISCSRVIPVILLLLAIAVLPAGASALTVNTVWDDTCVPFEQNNETAYNEKILASFAPVAANTTPVADYRNLSWSRAFISLNQLMKERYAFTRWRAVDFDGLNRTWAPAIANAGEQQDRAAYYRALRGYLFAIPDGHVNVLSQSGDFGAKDADIGGGFGFALVQLDSGEVAVSYVANGSAAEKAGVSPGDTVTAWNNREVHEAINATPHIWATKKPSTEEGIRLQKTRLLPRAPVGTQASVTVSSGSGSRSLDLTAYDDGYDTLKRSTFFLGKEINDIGAANPMTDIRPQFGGDEVTTRILPGGYTYIAVYEESYSVYQPFRAAVLNAVANKSPGMVIDLRFNGGGEDELASCMAGWFVDNPEFYEYTSMYDPGTRTFTPLSELWTRPQPTRFTGPVAVIVSPDSLSSGEGVPLVFAKSGRGAIVSWYGTNGAFGMNGMQAVMPLDLYILFPAGASLDEKGKIQVDSNASRTGGVAPTVRVPLNRETVARAMAGEDVQLTYAMAWLEKQQSPATTATPATPTQKAAAGMVAVLGAIGTVALLLKRK
jgi:carboxyl-terminal processing protease